MSEKKRFSLEDDQDEVVAEQEGKKEAKVPESSANVTIGEYDDYSAPEKFEDDKARLVDFLKFPKEKRKLTDFYEESYKTLEKEAVERSMHRMAHEHASQLEGATPWHKPGHIGSLMYQYLNMVGVENAFASGLQHTKSSMTKTVQQRVDEINTLLRGVGGFNRQLKASFSRSAVVYLEQEDPDNKHRERVIFSINISDFELRYPMDDETPVEDGRTVKRLVWDEAVNTLCEIVSNTGMKPKYVKNDKNGGVFRMQQYLIADKGEMPDEYFAFELRHIKEEKHEQMIAEYEAAIAAFDKKIAKLTKKMNSWFCGEKGKIKYTLEIKRVENDKDFFIATNPSPKEIDNGLLFSIFVNTMKDYTITKDKMQVIMTKYILALSNVAVDKSMDQQVNTVYQQAQKDPKNFQTMGEAVRANNAMKPMPKKKMA